MDMYSNSYSDITLLCIDDEQNILSSLKRELRSFDFKLLTAQSGAEGLSILDTEKVDIVISDMKMPEMSGVEFFENVTKHFPSVLRILLTGYTQMESLIDAVNKGNIHRYFEKPWSNKELTSALTDFAEKIRLERHNTHLQKMLKKQNKALFSLKASLESKVEMRTKQIRNVLVKQQKNEIAMQKLLYNVININPHMDGGFAHAVSLMAGRVAKHCELSAAEVKDIELAGIYCDMGLLGLDVQALSRPFETMKFINQQEYLGQIYQVSLVLSPADELRSIETILINQFEYINGSGFPNELLLADIPIGSRILAIARDYWRYRMGKIVESKLSHQNALREIKKHSGTRYDSALVDMLIKDFEMASHEQPRSFLNTPDLEPGMTLSRSVFGEKHILLLSEGHVLTHQNIQGLVRYEKVQNSKLKISVAPILEA